MALWLNAMKTIAATINETGQWVVCTHSGKLVNIHVVEGKRGLGVFFRMTGEFLLISEMIGLDVVCKSNRK